VDETTQVFYDKAIEVINELKATRDDALKQIEAKGVVDPETKEKQARLEEANFKIITDYKELRQKHDELKKVVDGLEEKAGRLPATRVEPQSLGRMFVESDEYKSLNNAGFSRGSRASVSLKTRFETKAAVSTILSTTYPAVPNYTFVPNTYLPAVLPLSIRNLLPVTPINTGAIEYVQETWTYSADYQTPEGTAKAQSSVEYLEKTATVKTIAHYIKISRQAAADIPQIMTSIDNRLRYGVLLKEDSELLYGSGATGHLSGLMTNATAATYSTGTGDTNLDVILHAIAQVETNGYIPTNVVVSVAGWTSMIAAKNSQGMYLYAGPPVGMPTPTLWGVPVTPSLSMHTADYLVGNFTLAAELFDRESVTVDIAFENEDDFIKNLITVRGEERVLLATYYPLALIKGTLANPTPTMMMSAQPGQLGAGSAGAIEGGQQNNGEKIGNQQRAKEKV
jgi:HK97 family phage major capsid protein